MNFKTRKKMNNPLNNNSGVGVVEVILILVVVIALVIIFQDQITALVNAIWRSINSSAKTIYGLEDQLFKTIGSMSVAI